MKNRSSQKPKLESHSRDSGSSMHMTLRPSAKRNALRSTLTAYAYTGSSENTNKSKKRKIHKVNAPILQVQNDNEESLVTPNANWNEMLLKIREMRVTLRAEVDEDGAETFYDTKHPAHVARFHVLISAMLSSQTKDPINAAAMRRLLDNGLTVESMIKIKAEKLAEVIYPVSFYRTKSKAIKKVALILKQRENEAGICDIPDTVEDLIALPGVGPKMAYLVMNVAWNKPVGICVDTHVHRICNRLGWVSTWNKKNPKAQDPEKTRKELEAWLPLEHWDSINQLLVGFGQTICHARQPKCEQCAIHTICPSAFKNDRL